MDNITFNIGGGSGAVQTIMLQTPLPALVDGLNYNAGVFIDGLTEPGAGAGANPPTTATLLIVLDGALIPPTPPPFYCHGIHIQSPNNTIQGLSVQNMPHDGISIEATNPGSNNNMIHCNFSGTDVSGTIPASNGWGGNGLWAGIRIWVNTEHPGIANFNTVDRNLPSANIYDGIALQSCPPGDVAWNNITNNYCGTTFNGTGWLGNGNCGQVYSEGTHDNMITGNVCCNNGFDGFSFVGYPPMGWYTKYAHIGIKRLKSI